MARRPSHIPAVTTKATHCATARSLDDRLERACWLRSRSTAAVVPVVAAGSQDARRHRRAGERRFHRRSHGRTPLAPTATVDDARLAMVADDHPGVSDGAPSSQFAARLNRWRRTRSRVRPPGTRRSDPVTERRRTIDDVVADLHRLLSAAKVGRLRGQSSTSSYDARTGRSRRRFDWPTGARRVSGLARRN